LKADDLSRSSLNANTSVPTSTSGIAALQRSRSNSAITANCAARPVKLSSVPRWRPDAFLRFRSPSFSFAIFVSATNTNLIASYPVIGRSDNLGRIQSSWPQPQKSVAKTADPLRSEDWPTRQTTGFVQTGETALSLANRSPLDFSDGV